MGSAVNALRIACCLALLALPAPAKAVVETLDQLQERFDREHDAVRKAKMLQKLGDAQFAREREAAKTGDYQTVGLVMEKYRDNARAALDAVKKVHPNAERNPGGYKQLEMHTQAGLREVNDLLLTVPEPFLPPLQIVKTDLLAIDDELLHLLFPRRPGEKPVPSKSDGVVATPAGEKKP